ncbi:hypothetical protein ACLM5H_25750 [Fredinandcohnia humi]
MDERLRERLRAIQDLLREQLLTQFQTQRETQIQNQRQFELQAQLQRQLQAQLQRQNQAQAQNDTDIITLRNIGNPIVLVNCNNENREKDKRHRRGHSF